MLWGCGREPRFLCVRVAAGVRQNPQSIGWRGWRFYLVSRDPMLSPWGEVTQLQFVPGDLVGQQISRSNTQELCEDHHLEVADPASTTFDRGDDTSRNVPTRTLTPSGQLGLGQCTLDPESRNSGADNVSWVLKRRGH